MALGDIAADDPEVRAILESSISHVEASERINSLGYSTSETSVRRYRSDNITASTPSGWEREYELGPDGGTICSGPVAAPITDPNQLLEIWNLDPEHIEVVGEMTVKAWDFGIKNPAGEVETRRLFSYKARIRKRQISALRPEVLSSWREAMQSGQHYSTKRAPKDADSVSYVVLVADPQLGKEGTGEAVANWSRGVQGHAERIQLLRDEGVDVQVVVAFMGDETEGVANNYANQAHTIELNLTEQLELDYDMSMWTLKVLLPLAEPGRRIVTSVRSNHGEWTRNGSKDVVTTKADNASTFIRSIMQKNLEDSSGYEDVQWHIGNQGPHVLVELDGVSTYLSHFYEQKGRGTGQEVRTRSAIERQIIGRTEELGDVKVFLTAHYHHFYMQEWEGRTQIGCPALEAEKSSGYMLNQYGVWSPPGMLGVLIGEATGKRGWAEPVIF